MLIKVSIPDRGLGCLRLSFAGALSTINQVSIPDRGLGCLRLACFRVKSKLVVSIPDRGLGCLRHTLKLRIAKAQSFNP